MTTSPSAPPPTDHPADPPHRPAASGRPFLRRSSSDRYLGGVLGGVAERIGVDPTVLRIAVAIATGYLGIEVGGGASLLLLLPYLVAWLVLPDAAGHRLVSSPGAPEARREAVLAVLAVVSIGVVLERRDVVVAAGAAIAYVLLRDRRTSPDRSSAGLTGAGQHPAGSPPTGSVPIGGAGARIRPRRLRPEPALWPLGIGLVGVVGLGAIVLDGLFGVNVDPRLVVDVLLLVLGSVMVVTWWRGRARLLVVAVLLLVPVWLATSVVDVGRFDGAGRRQFTPERSAPSGTQTFELGYGALDVDASHWTLPAGSEPTIQVRLTAGRAVVLLPRDVAVRVVGRMGVGRWSVSDVSPWTNLVADRAVVGRGMGDTIDRPDETCVENEGAGSTLVESASAVGLVAESATPSEAAVALAADGYPAPTFTGGSYDDGADVVYDDAGNPVTTTSRPGAPNADANLSIWSWNQQTYDGTPCRPEPRGATTTITVDARIGAGSLEIRRV